MRLYKNYARAGRLCRVSKGSTKCVKCVKVREPYDLALININKWRRLNKERKRL